jgi:HAMP domain-containing protein
MAENADATSKGRMGIPELPLTGAKEISILAAAFNRMHRSLEKAMKLIDNQ